MLQTTTNINIDFYDKKYILISAKQLDKQSRFLSITCYNHGEFYYLNEGEHSAYIRYRKADNNSVFNFCKIDRKGNIIVELTEQMLAVDGICVADLVVVNEGGAKVDTETGEIIGIENSSILSTMPLHIDVTGTAVANSDIESSYEFDGLNTALEKAEAEYTEVILTSKSYAVGGSGIRDGEDNDNAKYYYEQSLSNKTKAKESEIKASNSENLAESHMQDALLHSQNAKTYMTNAETYMNNTATSEANAASSEVNAANSEANAASSEVNAANSEANALSYKEIVENINSSIVSSINTLASSGTVGSFIFMGTITFEELMLLSDDEKAIGYVYCVTNDFATDDTFVNGSGLSYTVGTNVQYTVDGWNCLGGSSSSTATVDEVKDYLGI
jgi:hypothetical protein